MLGNGGYYMNSLNSRFWGSWIFFLESLTLKVEEDENFGLFYFSSLLNILFLVSFDSNYEFLPYMDCECDISSMRG